MIVPTDVFHLVIWMCGSAAVTANATIGSEICDIVRQRNVGIYTASGTECKDELSILHVPVRMMMYCLQRNICLLDTLAY
jgi:hypothetical protein